MEFEATFTSLAGFAPELVATEEHRCLEFEKTLRPKILMKVMGNMYREYDKLVEAAAHVEIMLEAKEARQRHKRLSYAESKSDTGSSKKSRGSSSSSFQSTPQQSKSSGFVYVRSSRSAGPINVTCFRCSQKGHIAIECKQNPSHQQPTRSQSQAQGKGQLPTCYHCKQSGHMKRPCPQLVGMGSASRSRKSGSYQVGQG